MAMKIKVDTVTLLAREWGRGAPKVQDSIREELDEIGDLLVDEANKRAPFESGELEISHSYQVTKDGLDRWNLSVTAGGVVNGVNVNDYAIVIHEGRGSSWNNLGPGSLAKNRKQKERVGEKFLERALIDNEELIESVLFDAIWRAFQ
tara:strand:- start:667 stop:1110 length:444 start_codon:yes stop_codon:yes gene_type:complete